LTAPVAIDRSFSRLQHQFSAPKLAVGLLQPPSPYSARYLDHWCGHIVIGWALRSQIPLLIISVDLFPFQIW